MAVRSTMADLIARVRLLIADPAGATQAFTDDQVQDFLDETRLDIRYEVLTPKPTFSHTLGIQWLDYYSDYEHWEADETLIWTDFTMLTPVTPTAADRIIGHWGFAASQVPAVLIAGKVYDVWLVAAELLDMRATTLALTSYDATAAGVTLRLGQIVTNLQRQAQTYRMKARPMSIATYRTDLSSRADQRRGVHVGPTSAGVPFLTGE